MTTNEVLQVVDSMPQGPEGMIVAVPGSVGALEPDAIDTTTLLSQVNLWFSPKIQQTKIAVTKI